MSVAVADTKTSVAVRRPDLAHTAQRLFQPSGSTLEGTILDAWEDLTTSGRAECPVCRGQLEPSGCARCGSELS